MKSKHTQNFIKIVGARQHNLKNINVSIPKNKFKQPSNTIIAKLYQFKLLRSYFNNFFPKKMLLLIKSVLFKDSKKPTLDPTIKRKLFEIYKKDIAELSKLLSKDLSAWQ